MDYRRIATTTFIKFLAEKYNFDIDDEAREYAKLGTTDARIDVVSSLSIENIIYQVEVGEGLPLGAIKDKRKTTEYVVVRHCLWHILFNLNKISFNFSHLGRHTFKSHSTVKHGVEKVDDMFKTNDALYVNTHGRIMNIVESEIENISKPLQNSGLKYFSSFYAKACVNH